MLQVLLALADGDKHGYAIIKEVDRRTGGEIALSAGTLYTIIRRFEQEGVIAESAVRPEAALDDERRRYYKLTEFGRDVARASKIFAMFADAISSNRPVAANSAQSAGFALPRPRVFN